jgi:hypothetical protein
MLNDNKFRTSGFHCSKRKMNYSADETHPYAPYVIAYEIALMPVLWHDKVRRLRLHPAGMQEQQVAARLP